MDGFIISACLLGLVGGYVAWMVYLGLVWQRQKREFRAYRDRNVDYIRKRQKDVPR